MQKLSQVVRSDTWPMRSKAVSISAGICNMINNYLSLKKGKIGSLQVLSFKNSLVTFSGEYHIHKTEVKEKSLQNLWKFGKEIYDLSL